MSQIQNKRIVNLAKLLPALLDHKLYDRLNSFITKNHDSVLGLIAYSSVFISEIIRNYPTIKLLLKKLLFRLTLLNKQPNDEDPQFKLTPQQEYLSKTFRSIYGYIADIRLAANIFGIIPYISTFLKDYNSIKKLRSIDSLAKLDAFFTFSIFAVYQVYENLGFILSHDFLPDSFNYLLFPQNRNDGVNSSSDWYYAYSCRLWFVYNIVDSLKTLYKLEPLSINQFCNDLLSYHWSFNTGVLNKPTFAVVGFLNSWASFRQLL